MTAAGFESTLVVPQSSGAKKIGGGWPVQKSIIFAVPGRFNIIYGLAARLLKQIVDVQIGDC
jgi:hypothetical protein